MSNKYLSFNIKQIHYTIEINIFSLYILHSTKQSREEETQHLLIFFSIHILHPKKKKRKKTEKKFQQFFFSVEFYSILL